MLAGLLGRGERRVVGERRVTAHAEEVLDAAFGGQSVVVPAHWVEDLLAGHALVARDDVGVGVAEDVANVQRARHRRWRRVDREDLLARGGAVEAVGRVLVPTRPSRCASSPSTVGFSGSDGRGGRTSAWLA